MKRLPLVLISFVILVIVFLSVLPNTVSAGGIQQENITFLPIVFNNWSVEPMWVKNPLNLPPAIGWPGWTGNVTTYTAECPGYPPPCPIYMEVQSPPDYLVVEGSVAIFPHLLMMGSPINNGCFAVVVTESYKWDQYAIWQTSNQPITFKWMSVPDPSQASPLEWAAQAREDVIANIPGCTNPDIGLYYLP